VECTAAVKDNWLRLADILIEEYTTNADGAFSSYQTAARITKQHN
jgi:hypothetical protein